MHIVSYKGSEACFYDLINFFLYLHLYDHLFGAEESQEWQIII